MTAAPPMASCSIEPGIAAAPRATSGAEDAKDRLSRSTRTRRCPKARLPAKRAGAAGFGITASGPVALPEDRAVSVGPAPQDGQRFAKSPERARMAGDSACFPGVHPGAAHRFRLFSACGKLSPSTFPIKTVKIAPSPDAAPKESAT